MENKYYVYVHYRLDNNQPFYVGKGCKSRYKEFNGRSELYNRFKNKYGVYSKIIIKELTNEQACEIEMYLIKNMGRINNKTGILVNLTDGGESGFNRIITDEVRKKISNTLKETYKNNPEIIERQKQSLKKTIKENPHIIDGIKEKLTGKKQSEETKEKRKRTLKETWQKEELRELKRQQTKKLWEDGVYIKVDLVEKGKKHSLIMKEYFSNPENRKKISEKLKGHIPHNKIVLEKEILDNILEDYINGMNVFNISKKYNYSRNLINRVLKENGLK